MPILRLFGADLALDYGATDTVIGAARVTATLTAHRVVLVVKGVIAQTDLDLTIDANCQTVGNRLTLTALGAASVVRTAILAFPDGSTRLLPSPRLAISTVANAGVEIADQTGTAIGYIRQPRRLPSGLQPVGTPSIFFYPDHAAGARIHCPQNSATHHFIFQDLFSLDPQKVINAEQKIVLTSIRFDANGYEVLLRPFNGAFFAHADVLDTSSLDESNEILFQYALVNGGMTVTNNARDNDLRTVWQAHPAVNALPAVVLLRYQDEHGHPIAARLTDGIAPLIRRQGVEVAVRYSEAPDQWEAANAALVIGAPPTQGNTSVPVEFCRLDPEALYSEYASGGVTDIVKPRFIQNGVAPIMNDGPSEIHGLARGAWLRRADRGPALQGSIAIEPQTLLAGKSFFHTDLKIDSTDGWELATLREERDHRPDKPAASSPAAVGLYSAASRGGQVSLPAIDLAFSLANMTGDARRTDKGLRLGQGAAFAKGVDRLRVMEAQFSGPTPTVFAPPSITTLQHRSGMRLSPGQQPFARVLDAIPTAALKSADTARPGAELDARQVSPLLAVAKVQSSLVFGGDAGTVDQALQALVQPITNARTVAGAALASFERKWRDLSRSLLTEPELEKLRNAFQIPVRALNAGADRVGEALQVAIALLSGESDVSDITRDPDALLLMLSETTGEELVTQGGLWSSNDPEIQRLWEHAWAPGDMGLLRRVVRYVFDRPNDADLQALFARLVGGTAGVATLWDVLNKPTPGLVADILQGVDGLWDQVVELWKTSPAIGDLRATFGPFLTRDVYQQLLATEGSAAEFLDIIRSELNLNLPSLAALSSEPPDYVLRTKRFTVVRSTHDAIKDLWSQSFDLCALPNGQNTSDQPFWSFFLDGNTTAIVKLSRKRSLPDILTEIVASYGNASLLDPLGLEQPLDQFLATLDPDLAAADWVGVLVLRPVADISRDLLLRDLVGFDHITASYVAVGGRKPPVTSGRTPSIDVWAHVFKQRPAGQTLPWQSGVEGDVHLALTKFDVRIRQTQLSAADIQVEIHPRDVWGRKATTNFPFEKVTIRGTLDPPQTGGGERGISFSAFFPTPIDLPINLAFVKKLALNSLRVIRANGSTCIDIDASLHLQDPPAGLKLNLDLGDTAIRLTSFRIPLPALPGIKIEMGAMRKLTFDLPAASFVLPKPRTFNLFGIELTPTGIGYIRRSTDDAALKRLASDYLWLDGFKINGAGKNDYIAYIEFSVDFGKSPSFGGMAGGLRFDFVTAFRIANGASVSDAYLGFAGVNADDITIDLFRMLTLEIKKLSISKAIVKSPDNVRMDAGALLAKNIKLKIFGWSPTPEGANLDLLMLHSAPKLGQPDMRGTLAFYDGGRNPPGDFFKLYWLLLAHNLELPLSVLTYLLESGPNGNNPPDKLLIELQNPAPAPGSVLRLDNVKLESEESWLFGLSFRLGELLTRCNLVLSDRHYYGIKLWAPWVEAVFQQESVELAYIPGPTARQDRFRTNLRIPAFDMLGFLKSGEFALEWGVNWDILIDIGFPWRGPNGYDWFRAFSIPVGAYEGKFGFYIEKRSTETPEGNEITLSAGVGLYVGYYFAAGDRVAWVRAGIGVFAVLQGSMTFRDTSGGGGLMALKSTLVAAEITGVVGIFAYGEGGVEVWILSARFRVSAQASVAVTIAYRAGTPCVLKYSASMSAGYSASVRVGSGFCSWTFRVSGQVSMPVSGQLLLS